MTYGSCALLGPGLPWRDTGDLPPPGQASCATSGGCHGCDGVTLTSSGFQSPNPAQPGAERSGAEQEAPQAVSEGHLPRMQPTALPQGKKRCRQPSTAPRDVVNNGIANKLFGPLLFFQQAVGFWLSGSNRPCARAGSPCHCPGSSYLPEGCFSMASSGRQSVGQWVSLDKDLCSLLCLETLQRHYRNRQRRCQAGGAGSFQCDLFPY